MGGIPYLHPPTKRQTYSLTRPLGRTGQHRVWLPKELPLGHQSLILSDPNRRCCQMPRGHIFLLPTQRARKDASWAQEGLGKGRGPTPSEAWERCSPRHRVGHRGRLRAKQAWELGASLESKKGGEPERSSPAPACRRGAEKVPPRSARACRHLSEVLKGPRGRQEV